MYSFNEFNLTEEKKKIDKKDETELSNFIYSKDFGDVLVRIKDDEISKDLIMSYENLKTRYTYVDITEEDDIVTFLYADVANTLDDEVEAWTHRSRQKTRIGRFILKLFGDKYSEMSIERFVNKYKSVTRETKTYFRMFSGEDIKTYYDDRNTEDTGTLGNSCMKFERCQEYLEMYSDNPKKIKLLVLFEKDTPKAIGRALIWKLDNMSNTYLMDRIYTSRDSDRNIFRRYAKDNGIYLTKYDNPIGLEKVYVRINSGEYDFYPYLDTLFLYQPSTGILTDDINFTTKEDIVLILDGIYGDTRPFRRN